MSQPWHSAPRSRGKGTERDRQRSCGDQQPPTHLNLRCLPARPPPLKIAAAGPGANDLAEQCLSSGCMPSTIKLRVADTGKRRAHSPKARPAALGLSGNPHRPMQRATYMPEAEGRRIFHDALTPPLAAEEGVQRADPILPSAALASGHFALVGSPACFHSIMPPARCLL